MCSPDATFRVWSTSAIRRSSGTVLCGGHRSRQGGGYRGHDGIRQYVSDLNDAWDLVRADVDDGIGVGDIASLVGRIHYRGKASGVETATPAGWMFKFRDGKVLHFRAFREPEIRLEAAGLSE